MSDRLALAHVIEDAGIPREKAEAVATAIARFIEGSAATKADLKPQKQCYAPTTAAELTARCAQVAIALVLFGCSTPASPWQRAGTSDDVMKADLAACETAAARSRNGAMGPIYDDYVTSCMFGLGYNRWR